MGERVQVCANGCVCNGGWGVVGVGWWVVGGVCLVVGGGWWMVGGGLGCGVVDGGRWVGLWCGGGCKGGVTNTNT